MCDICRQPQCDCLELLADDSLDAPQWEYRRPPVPKNMKDEFASLRQEECFYCGDPGGTVDHLVPVKRGGRHVLSNVVPCCARCNSMKNTRTLEVFYEEMRVKCTI